MLQEELRHIEEQFKQLVSSCQGRALDDKHRDRHSQERNSHGVFKADPRRVGVVVGVK
jgi:hypothetical protein